MPFVLASHCNKCIIKNDNIKDDFLFLFLQINHQPKLIIKEENGGFQKGNAQPAINIPKMYNEIKIPILSTEHQQRIVDFMDKTIGNDIGKLDKLVSKFKDYKLFDLLIYENYDEFTNLFNCYDKIIMFESLYKDFDKDYRNIKINKCFKQFPCEMKSLGEVCEFDIGFTPSTKNPEFFGDKYIWCTITDMNSKIIFNTERKITDKAIINKQNKLIKKGTLMMSFKLSAGKVAFAGEDMYCNEAIAFFKNYKNISDKYLYYTLKYLDYQKQKHLSTSQIGFALNKTSLSKLQIPVPSLEDQEKIIKMIEEINNEESQFNKTMESIKYMIETIYDKVEFMTDFSTQININNDNLSLRYSPGS